MPSFKAEAPHELGREEALNRLKGFLAKVEQEYQAQVSKMESTWEEHILNFALTTYGFKIEGQLLVEDDKARIEGKLPLAAVAFRGKIEKSISQALSSALT